MTILRLGNLADPRLDVFSKLTDHQLRNALDPARGIVIVESQIAIRVALQSGLVPISFLLDERRVSSLHDVLETVGDDVPVFVLPPDQAERLCGYRVTRGALCAMRRPSLPTMGELIGRCSKLVVVEGITDAANVGALFRNAAALGADGVLVAPTCADPLTRRSVRVSMGNVFRVPWTYADGTWPYDAVGAMRAVGYSCLALALRPNARDLAEVGEAQQGRRLALFFGSEGTGLSDGVLQACDGSVVIPMSAGVDSLNVAASSAVVLWELFARKKVQNEACKTT